MFRRISFTWSLMGASWNVLKKDRELLVFPLLSGICCLLVMASFLIPLILTGAWAPPTEEATSVDQVTYYGILFLFYFCNYFVIVFFNSGIVSCAVIRLRGGDPTVGDGFRAALSRLPYIAGWALLSATVGLILRIIEDRSKWIGKLVAGFLGMAWTVVSFLVIPILVVEKKGPIDALKDSTAMLRKTWGEQLVGNFGFGLLFFLLAIPGVILVFAAVAVGFAQESLVLGGVLLCLAVVYFIALSLVQSALQTIFQTVLYLYARHGDVPPGFDQQMLVGAMGRK